MVSSLIQSGWVNMASHPTLVQSFELIMTLAHHYIPEEVVKSVTGEIVLDLRPHNIKNVFHLPREDQNPQITYEGANRWYRENEIEVKELVQSKYLIYRTSLGRRARKVDMTQGYMIHEIGYSIVLLSRSMGLLATRYLEIWMIYFIETIRTCKTPID